jgi:hypothetical protein
MHVDKGVALIRDTYPVSPKLAISGSFWLRSLDPGYMPALRPEWATRAPAPGGKRGWPQSPPAFSSPTPHAPRLTPHARPTGSGRAQTLPRWLLPDTDMRIGKDRTGPVSTRGPTISSMPPNRAIPTEKNYVCPRSPPLDRRPSSCGRRRTSGKWGKNADIANIDDCRTSVSVLGHLSIFGMSRLCQMAWTTWTGFVTVGINLE